MDNAAQIKGGWTMARIEQVLANATARALMSGKSCPVAEAVLARLSNAR